jgi:hypothetical protein
MKNLEIKTKKMSLANIEGKLSITEMEQIMAGSGNRTCMIHGLLTAVAMGFGGWYGLLGGLYAANGNGCF